MAFSFNFNMQVPSTITVGAAKQLGKRKLDALGESNFDWVQQPGQLTRSNPHDDEVLDPGSSVAFNGSMHPNVDRVGQLEQDVGALREDNKQLHKTVMGMQNRMNALALRALVDRARTKINGGRELSAAEKATWNERVQRGELDQPELTQQQLALTKYGRGTIQGAGRDAAHLVSREDVAYAATMYGANHRALFQFVYQASADDFVFSEEE